MAKAQGISLSLTESLYQKRIEQLKNLEQTVLQSLEAPAKKSLQKLLSLTDKGKQNEQISMAIAQLESSLDMEKIVNSGKSAAALQQQYAQKLLALDQQLQVFQAEEGGSLKAIAEGKFDQVIRQGNGVTYVKNAELNKWITKNMQRIAKIAEGDLSKMSFTGFQSNLKGAYLEAAVVKELNRVLPKNLKIVNTGGYRSNNRQIAEDIMIIFGNDSQNTLLQVLSKNQNKKTISLNVPEYTSLQKQSFGISVKAGQKPIKFFEGNVLSWFMNNNSETDEISKYRTNVLNRSFTHHKDNDIGRSVNYYIVANHLAKALGENNLFLATREQMLSTMSSKLQYLKDSNKFLYMTNYSGKIKARVIEPS